ncbi:protein-tyrosine phosphatase-like protein, partial [Baffinella frigidus]
HYGCFLVINLCQHFEERGNGNYDNSTLFNQVQKIPCVDHNAPMMHQLLSCLERSTDWLNQHSDNVVSVHCQGGKGRTGTFIVGLLLWVGRFNNPTEAV